MTQMIRPSTSTGYGSCSYVSHGASASTRSIRLRRIRTRLSGLTYCENSTWLEPRFSAQAMRVGSPPIFAPPVPLYSYSAFVSPRGKSNSLMPVSTMT